MSLFDQANIAEDTDLIRRVAACAVNHGVAERPPTQWAVRHLWALASSPGWVEAYCAACEAGNKRPGADGSVITDQMILEAVSALVDSLAVPESPGGAPDAPGDEPEPPGDE